MRSFGSSIIVLLLASSASLAFAQDAETTGSQSTALVRSTHTSRATGTVASAATTVSLTVSQSPTRESTAYYPAGSDYDDTDSDAVTNPDADGGGAGKSDAFMGVGLGAQIGIIAAVVVIAIALFIGIIIYYFHRRKQWEREVKRRSALPMNAKIVVGKNGLVRLADRSSSSSKVGAEELEKGGHKVSKIEGEIKPGFFNMLLGKF